MKKLLLFLFTLLALTPPLSAQTKEHDQQVIFQAEIIPSGMGDEMSKITGILTGTAFDFDEKKEVTLPLIENGVLNSDNINKLYGTGFPRELLRLEYKPADGCGDVLIIEFDNLYANTYYTATNLNGKLGAILLSRAVALCPGGRIKIRTKFGGAIKWASFALTGTLNTDYSQDRAKWHSSARIAKLDDHTIFDIDAKAEVSDANDIALLYNTSGYKISLSVPPGGLIYSGNNDYSNTFNLNHPKYFELYNNQASAGSISLSSGANIQKSSLLFNSLKISWTEGDAPNPKVTGADLDIKNGVEDNGVISFSKEVTLKGITTDIDCKAYYAFSTEAPATDVEISDDNLLSDNNLPVFDESGYLTVVGVSTEFYTKSEPKTYRLIKLDNTVFDNLADAQAEANNNKLVTFSCPLLIEGIQNTQNNAKFMYVRDPQGNAIKFVNNGTDIFFNESKHYKVGQEIPAYGITGVYRHTEGWPQIEVYVGAGSDYRRYSADATSVMTDFGDYDPKRTTFGADDFNRHVVVSNLTWTGSESRFTDSEGKSLNAYGRFTAYQGILGTLKEDKSYTVEGFIGQIKGEPTIFPTGYAPEVMIYAPNPIIGEKDTDGWIDVNIISDDVTFTVNSDDFPSGTNLFKRVNGSFNKPWNYQYGNSQTLGKDEFVFNDKGILEVVLSTTYNLVDGAEQKIRFHKREVTKEFATLAEFNTEFRDATDIPEPNTDDTRFYRFTGRAEVRAVTPKYLYLRDADCAEGQESISSLLLYNENGWKSAVTNLSGATGNEPKVGDILTNFALIPDHTQLGNLRGYATNFARTLRRAQDGSGIEPTPKTKEATEAFSDDDRMVRYIVKGATVARDDKGVYTISNMPGNPVLNIGDVFEVTGGWATAWDPTKPFDIEGIVLRNGDAGYALAFYDFTAGESSPAMAVPTLEGVEDTDPTVGLSFATTAKVVLTLADADATADIWYTTDGSDPLNNPDKRSKYTAPFEISATATVKAYSAVAGAMPSAVVERTFTRTTSDRRYIINFLNQGHPGEMYNFTGTVAVAAIGKEYMFVRGAVGHYLPVKLTAEGASWTDKGYAVGNHLTGFMLGYHEEGAEGAVNRMGRVADAATLATWGVAITPDAGETIDVANPETTSAISAANARRMVTVKGVHINRGAAKADAWTMTEANGEGATYTLVPEVLGADMSAVTGEGQQFDVTGFVMYSADGALEMWPMSISRLTPAANVAITVDGKPAGATAEFTSSVKLEFSCPTPGAVIQYQFYNENNDTEPERWYTYEGRPVVIDESCRLHARATAPGFAVGNHTHLNLVRLDQTAAPAISAVEGTESSTVTISAEAGTVISWWTSEDATAKIYTAQITIEATTIVYATAKAEGKVESPVTHKLVKVAGSAAPSDKISGKVNISARLNEEGKPVVTITPADDTLTPGSYTIYYTLEEGVVLTPENGTEYTEEFTMQESGLVTAILVESGKSAGEPCSLNVWAGVTGIDGISGAEGESEVRVDGDSIIAPQGSEVYDLSGRRVNPTGLAGGIYIVRIPGGKAIKVRI